MPSIPLAMMIFAGPLLLVGGGDNDGQTIPPIDRTPPARFATATFATG